MKKNYKKILSILCLAMIGVSAYAQGTWKAAGTETVVANGVEMSYVGIYGLSVMNSEVPNPPTTSGVIGKSDTGAPTVSYNGISWDNAAMVQGALNGMYYALQPSSNGIIDISVKMSAAKNTYLAQIADSYATSITTLTATTAPTSASLGSLLPPMFASTSNYTLPQVYDTYNNTTNTWNGTAAINTSAAVQYMVMSFPVTANKIYVVGVAGSKLQLRGINYTLTTSAVASVNSDKKIFSIQNSGNGNLVLQMKESVKIGIYNTLGVLMSQKLVSPSGNSVDISRLVPGVYFIKDINRAYQTQKFIVK